MLDSFGDCRSFYSRGEMLCQANADGGRAAWRELEAKGRRAGGWSSVQGQDKSCDAVAVPAPLGEKIRGAPAAADARVGMSWTLSGAAWRGCAWLGEFREVWSCQTGLGHHNGGRCCGGRRRTRNGTVSTIVMSTSARRGALWTCPRVRMHRNWHSRGPYCERSCLGVIWQVIERVSCGALPRVRRGRG